MVICFRLHDELRNDEQYVGFNRLIIKEPLFSGFFCALNYRSFTKRFQGNFKYLQKVAGRMKNPFKRLGCGDARNNDFLGISMALDTQCL